MNITLNEEPLNVLPARTDRAPGLHVSDIYNGLYKELEPARYGGTGGPNELKMAVGLSWEQYLAQRLIESGMSLVRPAEQTTAEGIAYNPDGLQLRNGSAVRGLEYKATWMSDPGPAINSVKFAKYITQMKAYGYNLSLSDWSLYVLFLNGDYRQSRNPVLRRYDFEFSAKELKSNWDMLTRYAQARKLR